MSLMFSADEVFEMGEQIERNGEAFYNSAATAAGSKEIRETLRYLAGEEAKHLRVFQELRSKLPRSAAPVTIADDIENVEYLSALAGSKVFANAQEAAQAAAGMKSASDVFQLALRFEKDSILFFQWMQGFAKPEWGRGEISKLVEQEQDHVRTIWTAMQELG